MVTKTTKQQTVITVDTTAKTVTTEAAKGQMPAGTNTDAPRLVDNPTLPNLQLEDTPRAEGETRIHNLIILDESGSMSPIRSQALSGANETLGTIRKAQAEDQQATHFVTFVTFDSDSERQPVRAIINNKPITEVNDITTKDYEPCGCTPLNDAIGMSVMGLKRLVKPGESVLVTIITDGMENSSRAYSPYMVKQLIEELRAEGWVFTFIGANQDSAMAAGTYGIHNSMDFCQDAAGTEMMFRKMNSSHMNYYRKERRMRETGIHEDMEADFFSDASQASRVTPHNISYLLPGQVFVFGSNLNGMHFGGAARAAVERFGAVMGEGVGLHGQSYAIPTMQGGVETIKPYVDEFLQFADAHPELTFLVTRIGCGIAGFSPREIAPLFAGALGLQNVWLPADFWNVLNYKYNR